MTDKQPEALRLAALLEKTAAPKVHQNIPLEAISRLVDETMAAAVANGANSVSMSDHIVEVAAWLCNVPTPTAQSSPTAQGDALDAMRYRWLRENWSTMGSTYHDDKMQLYVGRPKYTNITPVDIDVAIDAARAAQGEKT